MNLKLIWRISLFCWIVGIILAGCGAQGSPPSPAAAPRAQTLNGIILPPDAAPPEHQVLRLQFGSNLKITTLDFFESVYSRFNIMPLVNDLSSDALVRTNKNYVVVPGAATAWTLDPSGRIWTFQLDPALMWSDDTPVTADDYVATFRYAADPKHNWDFNWFYSGIIKNWDEVTAGKLPPDQLGVQAIDAHTLQFETIEPAPYFPALMSATTFQKKSLEQYGNGSYNSNPATTVSSGPFILKQWVQDQYFVLEANPKYQGTNKPYIQRIIATRTDKDSDFAAYMNNEIDFVDSLRLSPTDKATILGDPQLSKELHLNYGDFRTFYLFYDMQKPPFDNLKVRQAFSHMIDRDTLIAKHIGKTGGIPAYSYLMPGFPAADPDAYKDIQDYDPALARQLLAEAGYPDGKGFPKLTMWLRKEPPEVVAAAQAIADGLKQDLGVDVEILNQERAVFADALSAKQIQFGLISYGMDYMDPFNMLGVFLSGGRHNWNNAAFDAQVKKAGAFTGDPKERIAMFQAAERLLVEDVAGVFIFHRTFTDLYRPYLVGYELTPNDFGIAAFHVPGYNSFSTLPSSVYVSKDVLQYRKEVPKSPGDK